MKYTSLIFIITLSLVLGGCNLFKPSQNAQTNDSEYNEAFLRTADVDKEVKEMMEQNAPGTDQAGQQADAEKTTSMAEITYQYFGELFDVTKGKKVRGVTTDNKAAGVARATLVDGQYNLLATFRNLPQPQGDDFYEGWVVRRDPFEAISVGRVEKISGAYINSYISSTDLTDHAFYVLTLEPNDNNPAPADHIVEGEMYQ